MWLRGGEREGGGDSYYASLEDQKGDDSRAPLCKILLIRGFVLCKSLERRLKMALNLIKSSPFNPWVLNIAIAELKRGALVNLLNVSLCTTLKARKLSCEYLTQREQPYIL